MSTVASAAIALVLLANVEEDMKRIQWVGNGPDEAGEIKLGSCLDAVPAEKSKNADDPRDRIAPPTVSMPVAKFRAMVSCPKVGKVVRHWIDNRQIRVVSGPADVINEFARA